MQLRPKSSNEPKIELTPLIDVVFLMLIFFMVSTTFDKQTELKVQLPNIMQQETPTEAPLRIDIVIDRQGKLYVNREELLRSDALTLRRVLEKIVEEQTDVPVMVTGDKQAPLQAMMTVMDVTAQLGLQKLHFSANQMGQAK